jgi:hypothetical protein
LKPKTWVQTQLYIVGAIVICIIPVVNLLAFLLLALLAAATLLYLAYCAVSILVKKENWSQFF